MTHALATADKLTAALDTLVDRVPGAEYAVVLSSDGLPLGWSRTVEGDQAEQVAGLVSGLHAFGQATARVCGTAVLHQVVVQMSRAFVFVATIRSGAILAVRLRIDADIADMAYEVALFVARAERDLPVHLEPARP
ncbi:roadblock/LC7 domain-containing protein [Micromonospora yasonensis]|uniref:roadblock/LC7 domain-containing protein n=1 Tax=Micromonospora yasonensis TaxID=1128667 RepID=UPI00222EEB50|nr:roadblock/LC7 domain-containing protein [Micromonospora yasonensis]MCW3841894.1 roadblock/LC7 domain-containing protein [Micromonospora yasonensis]